MIGMFASQDSESWSNDNGKKESGTQAARGKCPAAPQLYAADRATDQ
jgi:hypothetical protein